MATLTYDPTPADQPEFSEEEQDSLAVGEQLAEQENQLLAGKFQDAEALEKAYMELQAKLGDNKTEESEPVAQEETEEEEVKPLFDRLWEQATNNDVSVDTINELNEKSPEDLAKMYLEYRQQVEENKVEPQVLNEQEVTNLKGIVGGEAEYDQMIGWASNNLAESEIKMYDAVMEKGDPLACFFAVQALNYRYQEGTGFDGQMITGKPAPEAKADVFRSQAEVVAAMSDPRYDKDPAYREDVYKKLERSELSY